MSGRNFASVCAADAAVVADGGGSLPRSPEIDFRIAVHEASRLVAGRSMGATFGGASINIDPELGYRGLVWGPDFEARFSGAEHTKRAVAQISTLMPELGEDRRAAAAVYANVHVRVIELCAGSIGEKLFCDGEPWSAVDDRMKEAALCSLICSSSESMAAFVNYCEHEAANILTAQRQVVTALVDELIAKRELDGEGIDQVIRCAVTEQQLREEHARREQGDGSSKTLPGSWRR